MQLDLLVRRARVVTMDPGHPTAHTIGIWRGAVAGLDGDVEGMAARQTLDAGGRTVLPGFVDAHTHLVWAGLGRRSVDLAACRSVADVERALSERAATTPPDRWVDAVRYDQRPLGRHLSAHDLDAAVGRRRAYVVHTSGHACVVSSAVLDLIPPAALAGTPGVERDEADRPTGLFLEDAQALALDCRRPYSLEELTEAIEDETAVCAAQGITTIAEAGVAEGMIGRSPIEAMAYQRLAAAGRLRVRARLMTPGEVLDPVAAAPGDDVRRSLRLGLASGFGGDTLALGPIKLWLDGGMMARTAALTEPYVDHDGTGGAGELTGDPERLSAIVTDAHAAGWQVALHAIGDRAVDRALDLFAAAQARRPDPDARHRIEHGGLVRPDQLARLAAGRITVVTQPEFLHAFGDDYAAVMGPKRADWMYRGRSFLDHGIRLAGSSDRPVVGGSVLRAVQFMVDRTSCSGQVIGGEEALSVGEALEAYTRGGAYACRLEDRLGSLSPGKLADLVVLGEDPYAVPASSLADIPVVATLRGGEWTHGQL